MRAEIVKSNHEFVKSDYPVALQADLALKHCFFGVVSPPNVYESQPY